MLRDKWDVQGTRRQMEGITTTIQSRSRAPHHCNERLAVPGLDTWDTCTQVWEMPAELKRLRGLAKEDESDDAACSQQLDIGVVLRQLQRPSFRPAACPLQT